MLLKESLEKLYPAFLNAFNAQPFRPCRLFILTASLLEGLTVRHVTGDTPEKAWSVAENLLKESSGGGVLKLNLSKLAAV